MRAPVLLAVIAVLAVPAAAGAKEVTAVEVCGTDGCTRIDDRAALRAFEQGSELAQAPPAGRQRSYRLRVRVRDEAGASRVGWTSLWLPDAAVIAFDDGQQGATFTPVEPALSRALHRAARGHTARAARRYAQPPPATARVAEVVPAPVRASASGPTGADGHPALMWTGAAGVVLLLGAGAWRARRR
ncbi:MAG TPA: hypothetical protein VF080_03845 [Solirubrobacteraceae bacterium]